MKISHVRLGFVAAAMAMMTMPTIAAADGGDSPSDVDGGFHNTVASSAAVIIRVPVSNGTENSAAAEMHLIGSSSSTAAPADVAAAWSSGTNVSTQPVVTPATVSRDTSTRGWYGWSPWSSYNNYYSYSPYYYYYSSYYPSYYTYYSYGNPYYYSNYYGYNYYYYPYRGYGYSAYGYR